MPLPRRRNPPGRAGFAIDRTEKDDHGESNCLTSATQDTGDAVAPILLRRAANRLRSFALPEGREAERLARTVPVHLRVVPKVRA